MLRSASKMGQLPLPKVSFVAFVLLAVPAIMISALDLSGCGEDGGGSLVLVESHRATFYCNLDQRSDSSVNWTLVDRSGHVLHMASCLDTYRGMDCTRALRNVGVDRGDLGTSSLTVLSIRPEMAGTLVCAEIRGRITKTTNCTLQVVPMQLSPCPRGEEGLLEKFYVTCKVSSTDSRSQVNLTLVNTTGHSFPIGSCTGSRCVSPMEPDFKVTRWLKNKAYVSFRSVQRQHAGTLTCTMTYDNRVQSDSCTVEVYNKAKVDNCSVTVQHHNWSLMAACDFDRLFSANGVYEYSVMQDLELHHHGKSERSLPLFEDRRGFNPGQLYINSTDRRSYYRGSVTHTFPTPVIPGTYNYSLFLFPGGDKILIEKSVVVAKPSKPTHNCTKTNTISTNTRLACVCFVANMGSPAGRLLWLLGDTVLAAGDYGVPQLEFPSDKVTPRHEGLTLTCQLDWVEAVDMFVAVVRTERTAQTPAKCNSTNSNSTALNALPTARADSRHVHWVMVGAGSALSCGLLVIVVVVLLVMWRRGRLRSCVPRSPSSWYSQLTQSYSVLTRSDSVTNSELNLSHQ